MSSPDKRNVTPPLSLVRFWLFIGLLILVDLGPMALGWRSLSGTSYPMMFIVALLLHWGLAGIALASLIQASTTVIEGFRDRKVVWRTVFNITQYAICLGVGYLCLAAFGFDWSIDLPAPITVWTLPALLVAGAAALLTNTLLVGTSIALHLRTSWWREVVVDIGPQEQSCLRGAQAPGGARCADVSAEPRSTGRNGRIRLSLSHWPPAPPSACWS